MTGFRDVTAMFCDVTRLQGRIGGHRLLELAHGTPKLSIALNCKFEFTKVSQVGYTEFDS